MRVETKDIFYNDNHEKDVILTDYSKRGWIPIHFKEMYGNHEKSFRSQITFKITDA